MRRDLRAPSPRLRWGRRNDPDVPVLGDESAFNELDVQPEKRKPVRLRWGRSYKPGAEEVRLPLCIERDYSNSSFEFLQY